MQELDVRVISPRDKHPTIHRTFDALRPGEQFVLINRKRVNIVVVFPEMPTEPPRKARVDGPDRLTKPSAAESGPPFPGIV